MTNDQAFNAGYDAFKANNGRNPFDSESTLAMWWAWGYDTAWEETFSDTI